MHQTFLARGPLCPLRCSLLGSHSSLSHCSNSIAPNGIPEVFHEVVVLLLASILFRRLRAFDEPNYIGTGSSQNAPTEGKHGSIIIHRVTLPRVALWWNNGIYCRCKADGPAIGFTPFYCPKRVFIIDGHYISIISRGRPCFGICRPLTSRSISFCFVSFSMFRTLPFYKAGVCVLEMWSLPDSCLSVFTSSLSCQRSPGYTSKGKYFRGGVKNWKTKSNKTPSGLDGPFVTSVTQLMDWFKLKIYLFFVWNVILKI